MKIVPQCSGHQLLQAFMQIWMSRVAFDVFKAAQNLPNTKLIVKLHPREFADSDYYSAIAAEAGCKNYVIDKTSDLYQQIAACDVLITCFSTMDTEGVAFQAFDADSLATILSGIFRGTLRVDRAKYGSFIRKYIYRIDGKVAERCIEAITTE